MCYIFLQDDTLRQEEEKMKKVHYAWVVCAAGTLAMICNMGVCSTLMSAFLPYIKATGISGSESSMIVSVRSFCSLATMFLVPLYYRKVSLRLGMTLATVLGGVGMLVFALGGSVWVYYIGAGIAACIGLLWLCYRIRKTD